MDSSKERYISELKEWVARYELQIEQKDKRIAELEAENADPQRVLDEERKADAEIQEMLKEYMDDAEEFRRELAEAIANLRAIVSNAQHYQPGGSPPPGGAVVLVPWIMVELARERDEALTALKCEGPCPICGKDELCALHGKLLLASIPSVRHSDESWSKKVAELAKQRDEAQAALAEEQSERVDADTKVIRLYRELGQVRAALAEERARLDFFRYGSCTDAAGRKLK